MNVGPAYADWDFGVLKNFKVTESKRIQFRAELFDILNRANFRLPDSDISSPTFNYILEAGAPRQVQFALKFMYQQLGMDRGGNANRKERCGETDAPV